MQQFDFSGKGFKKRQRTILIFCLASTPCVFLLIFLTSNINMSILLIACACMAILELLFLTIQTSKTNRSLRSMKVCIDNDRITKKFDKGEQSISFRDIVSMKLTKNSMGAYINIIICGKDKKIIHLFDFDRMHEIVDLIRERVSSDVDITTKQNKIDPDNPVWLIFVGIITLVIIALVRQGGQHLEDIFYAIISLIAASFLLIYRPLSKSNLGQKRFEILFICFLILTAIVKLIGILMPK